MRPLPLLLLLVPLALSAVGCPKSGGSSETSGEQAPVTKKSRWDSATRAYLDALSSRGIVGFDTADEGAAVVYDRLTLDDASTFRAETSLRLMDEDAFSCIESGSWSLDNDRAESETVGRFTFEVTESDCPGRVLPKTLRAKLEIDGDDVAISQF